MAREFERTQRVSNFLHEELARLLRNAVRDPRVIHVNITGVKVSRDLSHAKIFFTLMDETDSSKQAEMKSVLANASGFLRSELAKTSSMRTVPRLSFRFDESVSRSRDIDSLLREARRQEDMPYSNHSSEFDCS